MLSQLSSLGVRLTGRSKLPEAQSALESIRPGLATKGDAGRHVLKVKPYISGASVSPNAHASMRGARISVSKSSIRRALLWMLGRMLGCQH